jgi:hypothetical protein
LGRFSIYFFCLQSDLLEKNVGAKDAADGETIDVADRLDAVVEGKTYRDCLYGLFVQKSRCDAVHDCVEYFEDLEAILG